MTQLAGPSFKPEELKAVLNTFEEDGTLIKGFLIEDFHQVPIVSFCKETVTFPNSTFDTLSPRTINTYFSYSGPTDK